MTRHLTGNVAPVTTSRERNPRGQGARLRDELVQAADRLLEGSGGEADLSMRAVTREAGVAPQSIYPHFADKRELMHAVYELRFGELIEVLASAAADAADPRARLTAFARAYLRYGAEHPGHYRVLFGTAGTPGWEPERMTGLTAFDMLREAVGDCRHDDVDEATVVFWAGLHGLVMLRRDRPSFPWPADDGLLRALVAGAAGDSAHA
jgi:AcrR family transcriptional regulator